MKTKTIKTQGEVDQAIGDARPIEVTSQDGSIRSIRIGNLIVGSDYGMRVTAVVLFEEADRYRVSLDTPLFGEIEDYFEDQYVAEEKRREYRKALSNDVTITVDKVRVEVDESGSVSRVIEVVRTCAEEVAF